MSFMQQLPKAPTILENLSCWLIAHLHVLVDQHHCQLRYQDRSNRLSCFHYLDTYDYSRKRSGIHLRLRCDSTSASAYTERIPFEANTLFSCYRYAEPESPVYGQAALAEQRRRRDLGPLPIPGSAGST